MISEAWKYIYSFTCLLPFAILFQSVSLKLVTSSVSVSVWENQWYRKEKFFIGTNCLENNQVTAQLPFFFFLQLNFLDSYWKFWVKIWNWNWGKKTLRFKNLGFRTHSRNLCMYLHEFKCQWKHCLNSPSVSNGKSNILYLSHRIVRNTGCVFCV